VVGQVPTRVTLVSVQALNNAWDGILVEAGNQVTIDGAEAAGSGIAGIRIDNVDANDNLRTSVVQITNPIVHDNGRLVGISESGIGLNGVKQVTITGGIIYHTDGAPGNQVYGIGLYRNKFGIACDQVTILNVAVVGLQSPPVVPIHEDGSNDPTAVVQNGHYDLSGNFKPDGVLSAPAGSVYEYLPGQVHYHKVSGFDSFNWSL
jgi:hypothetical protein